MAMEIPAEPNDGLVCNLYGVRSVVPAFTPMMGTTGRLKARTVTVMVRNLIGLEEAKRRAVAEWAAGKFGISRDKVTVADDTGDSCSFAEWPEEREAR